MSETMQPINAYIPIIPIMWYYMVSSCIVFCILYDFVRYCVNLYDIVRYCMMFCTIIKTGIICIIFYEII